MLCGTEYLKKIKASFFLIIMFKVKRKVAPVLN
jgi:hypothetical protein